MKRVFVKLSCLALIVTAIACNNNREQSASGSHDSKEVAEDQNDDKFESRDARKDADFVSDQVSANYADIELARLASERSSNSEVKRIAKEMITAHQKSVKELEKFAAAKAISVPSKADDDDLKPVNNLRDKNDAAEFNRDWCEEMVDNHEKAISDYEDQMARTEDPDLKTWINNELPGLRKHLDELKACHEKLKKS